MSSCTFKHRGACPHVHGHARLHAHTAQLYIATRQINIAMFVSQECHTGVTMVTKLFSNDSGAPVTP